MGLFSKKLNNKYNKRDLRYFEKENPHPTALQNLEEGERIAFNVPKYEHTKGKVVTYKGKLMVIREINKQGVYLEPLDTKEGMIDSPLPEKIFVREKDYYKNVHVHPIVEINGSFVSAS